MNALRLWFAGRSLRERRAILAAAALAVMTLVWVGVLRPLDDALATARDRQRDAVIRLADTRAAIDALHAAQAGRAATLAGTLADTVRASADQAGFTLASLDVVAPDRVRVGIASARGGALVGWLARLEQTGVLVDAAQLTDHGDRTVGVDLTLKARGR
jgi:general secretion pathway protein M